MRILYTSGLEVMPNERENNLLEEENQEIVQAFDHEKIPEYDDKNSFGLCAAC